jgi:predicted nucleic acid-binding protein
VTPPVVYLDTCAVNRLTDDLSQPRVLLEARAVASIFSLIQAREVLWVASDLLATEISRNPNLYKREFAASLLPPAEQLISPTPHTFERATQLTHQGLFAEDALHLALAERANAEWFITTDDRLLRRTADRQTLPVSINPVDWVRRRQPWLVPKS